MSEVIWVWAVELPRRDPAVDITGWDVIASDGDIGSIDEATYETGASAIVVDTKKWIFGKRRLLPAGVVNNLDPENQRVFVSCTKAEVRAAPDYNDEAADPAYRDGITTHYSGSVGRDAPERSA